MKHEPLIGSGFWIGVDLDGTLAEYHEYISATHIGKPIERMVDMVKGWIGLGYDVRIFTARVDGGHVADEMGLPAAKEFHDVTKIRGAIEDWCFEHLGTVLYITNVKDFGMVALYDDRAHGVCMNTGQLVCQAAYIEGSAFERRYVA